MLTHWFLYRIVLDGTNFPDSFPDSDFLPNTDSAADRYQMEPTFPEKGVYRGRNCLIQSRRPDTTRAWHLAWRSSRHERGSCVTRARRARTSHNNLYVITL